MHAAKPVLSARLLCTACAAFTAGIAGHALFSPVAVIITAIVSAFVICVIFKKLPYLIVTIIALLAFLGGTMHFYTAEKRNHSFSDRYAGRYVTVSGSITDISFTDNESQQIIINADSISALGKTENKSVNLCLYTDLEKSFSVGDKITFSDIFTPFKKTSSHGFDSETYFYARNIPASFSLSSEYISFSPGNPTLIDKIRLFSEKVSGQIRSLIGGDEGEVAAAILLGDKSGFSDSLTGIFTKSGISHIVAVSGMHLSVLIGFFFFLAAKSRVHYKIRNISGIIIVLLYMALTGFSPSVTRAGIMTICALVAVVFDRKEDIPTTFFLSAAIILAINPYDISDAGFLLSYTALAGILIFAGPIKMKLKILPRQLCDVLSATLSATITTFPVLAYIFNSATILSPITNIIVVPLVSSVFVSVLALSVLGFVCFPVASALAVVPKFLIKSVLAFAKLTSLIPYSTINVKSPGTLWNICYLILATLLYLWLTGRRSGKPGVIALSFVICATAISISVSALTCSVIFFDIGQGDCALVRLPGYHHCLIDTGPNGKSTVSALRSVGVNSIDVIFISHADTDHSGGLADVLENFPTRKVVFPNYDIMSEEVLALTDVATKSGADVEFVSRFYSYSFSGMTADVLWPSGAVNPGNQNDGSLVIRLDIKGNTFLFTGDISSAFEPNIKRQADADVLKVSHHGSDDSTSSQFLDDVSPRFSVISAGRNNFYGHPAEETLTRLEDSGSNILRTDLLGDITFKIDLSGNMEVKYETD